MSAFGYHRQTTPFLDALIFGQGARAVPMAFSNCASTETALWSLFSSRRTRHLAANAPCLHDMLRAAGFKVRFLLSGSHRHWMGLDYPYGSDYDTFTDNLNDEQLVEEANNLPAPAEAGDFLFFHLMSTHMASSREAPKLWTPARNRAVWAETGAPDADARTQILNHYDNSVLQADGYIARIMETLRQKGYLDDALVVVTGDHGEALGERNSGVIGHARNLYRESIQIPLIIWDSTGPLPETAFLADLTDIAPTVLGLIGMVPPSSWQGSSFLETPGRRSVHTEQITHNVGELPTHMEALIALLPSGIFKTMRYRKAGREVFRKVFCLSDDAGETTDLTGHLPPGVEAELEHRMREYHDQPALALSANWRFLDRQG
jgi:arylsulfatase A-like enzyme